MILKEESRGLTGALALWRICHSTREKIIKKRIIKKKKEQYLRKKELAQLKYRGGINGHWCDCMCTKVAWKEGSSPGLHAAAWWTMASSSEGAVSAPSCAAMWTIDLPDERPGNKQIIGGVVVVVVLLAKCFFSTTGTVPYQFASHLNSPHPLPALLAHLAWNEPLSTSQFLMTDTAEQLRKGGR